MKTKQGKIIESKKVLDRLCKQDLPGTFAKQLFDMRYSMKKAYEFQEEQEEKIFDKYSPVSNGDGSFRFDPPENLQNFLKEINELAELDAEIDAEPIKMKMIDELKISGDDIEHLSTFITFE